VFDRDEREMNENENCFVEEKNKLKIISCSYLYEIN